MSLDHTEPAQHAYDAFTESMIASGHVQRPFVPPWDKAPHFYREAWRAAAAAIRAHAGGSFTFDVAEALGRIEEQQRKQHHILEELKTMGITQQQFDDYFQNTFLPAEAARDQAVASAFTAVSTAIADLQAKIASNPTAPVADLAAELAGLQTAVADAATVQANAAAITAQVTAADPGPTTVPTTPVDPTSTIPVDTPTEGTTDTTDAPTPATPVSGSPATPPAADNVSPVLQNPVV